ncbi:MAG: acyl-CoA thioester hydrolase/BAAT C-terminal domain-containing protein, partial [Pseudohongiella sp.]
AQRDEFISQGYAFLALGYFGAENTPLELDRIALEGVYNAILQAAENPAVNAQCIALIGGSKGAELALLLASEYPDIKAVVAMAPGSAVFAALTMAMNTPSFSLNGEPLPFVPVPMSATPALLQGDLRGAWVEMMKNEEAMAAAAIPVENINGPIFFVSAARDEFWPSTEMSQSMQQRLEDNNFPHHVEHLATEDDHASVLNHFDEVETFLRNHFLDASAPASCSTRG